MAKSVVIVTCASPSPNTARRIVFNCGRLNSRPIGEHQEDDAELGEIADVGAVGHPRERVGADGHADDQDSRGSAEAARAGRRRPRRQAQPSRTRISCSVCGIGRFPGGPY
jgi:hypothetical protein